MYETKLKYLYNKVSILEHSISGRSKLVFCCSFIMFPLTCRYFNNKDIEPFLNVVVNYMILIKHTIHKSLVKYNLANEMA